MEKETALPKNVRQIGDIQGNKRVYMEDYVVTYIHRKEKQEETGGFLGVFLGERQKSEKETRLFVRGLMNIPLDHWEVQEEEKTIPPNKKTAASEQDDSKEKKAQAGTGESGHMPTQKKYTTESGQENPAVELSQSEKEDADAGGRKKLQSIELWQQKLKAGKKRQSGPETDNKAEDTEMEASWGNDNKDETAVLNEISSAAQKQEKKTILEECREYFGDWEILGCCVIGRYPVEAMKQLMQEVPESRRFLYHLQEQEEHLYWTDTGRYEEVTGYFVFYEQNRNMQEYIAQSLREKTDAKEKITDQAIQAFREKIRKKDQMRSVGMMKLASSFFVVTVLVIGAVVVTRVGNIRDTGDAVQNEIDQLEDASSDVSVVRTSGGNLTSDAIDSAAVSSTDVTSSAELSGTTGSNLVTNSVGAEASAGAGVLAGTSVTDNSNVTDGSGVQSYSSDSVSTAGSVSDRSAAAVGADSTAAESAAGTISSAGVESTVGSTGSAGVESAVGSTGSAGVEPTVGSTGSVGVEPTVGSTGNVGVESAVGNTGSAGVDSTSGVTGNAGMESAVGSTESAEVDSTAGSTGAESAVGTSGDAGVKSTAAMQSAAESPADTAASQSSGVPADTAASQSSGTLTDTAASQSSGALTDTAASQSSGALTDTAASQSSGVPADTAASQSSGALTDTAASQSAESLTDSTSPQSAASSSESTAADSSAAAGTASEVEAAATRQIMSSYVIREGDTLADICQKYYGSLNKLEELCQANGIDDANIIMPGQKIVLP